MDQFSTFITMYGWQLALIALVGIIILGALKYTNAFSKVEKEKRKPIYFGISLGFSVVAAAIYLLIIKQFDINYLLTFSFTIYGLNQTMYSIYENTSLRDLLTKVFKTIADKISKKVETETKKLTDITEKSEKE